MTTVQLSDKQIRLISKSITLLRDRHYRNYFNAKDRTSETAMAQRKQAEELDELRYQIVVGDD
jgi:hypothetical protein